MWSNGTNMTRLIDWLAQKYDFFEELEILLGLV